MELKNVTLNTADMSYNEVNALIQGLRSVRARKKELHERVLTMQAMVSNMRDSEMAWVNRYTGEVFDPEDWQLYDETTHTFYNEEVTE